MVTFLLHDPWFQCYLVFAGSLSLALLWDYLRRPAAAEDGPRTPRHELLPGGLSFLPSPDSRKPPRPVSRLRRPTRRRWTG
jgi:hypothetical protein